MPTYNFKCPEHGWLESMMSISKYENLKEKNFKGVCTKDNCMNECEPVIGTPRVEFNTTGFYCTDQDPKATTAPEKETYKVTNDKYKEG